MDAETVMRLAVVTEEPAPKPPEARLLRNVVPKAMQTLRDRATGKLKPVPLRLVHEPWTAAEDALGGGLWPGLYVVVGATGTGKTQLCLSLALGAALEGCPVAYIGLELDDEGIVARLVGLLASRPWSGLYTGQQKANRDGLPMVDDPVVMQAEKDLGALPFLMVDGEALKWSPLWLADAAQRLVKEAQDRNIDVGLHPPVIVLDFLQLVGTPMPGDRVDLRQRIQEAAVKARQIARDNKVVVIAVSSTARGNVEALRIGQDAPLPHPATLVGTGKESGEIEYSCDGVLVLVEHPDAKELQAEETEKRRAAEGLSPAEATPNGLVSVVLAKFRAGKTTRLWLTFDGSKHEAVSDEKLKKWTGVHKGQPGGGSTGGKPPQGKGEQGTGKVKAQNMSAWGGRNAP